MNFSAFVIFILLVKGQYAINSRIYSPVVQNTYLSCGGETRVDPYLVMQIRHGKWEADESLKHFVHCVLVKNDLMTSQGIFQMDVALTQFHDINDPKALREYEENIDLCLPKKADRPVEIAWKFAKCYQQIAYEYSLF